MTKHKDLQKAILQMADGSKSAFHTFYLGSAQFVYNSARLLYGNHKSACRFMVDFYQYLYLHVPEYKPSQSLETWISRLIMERFSQLSIGKNQNKPSVKEQMNAGTTVLEAAERERVWRLLEERMHFPKEDPKKSGGGRILLFVPLLLLAVLLVFHYRETVLEKLRSATRQENSDEQDETNDDTDNEAAENDENEAAGNPDGDPDADTPPPDSSAPLSDDDTSSLINKNDGGDGMQTPDGQASAPEAPTVDTPTVDTPSPNEPTIDTPTVDEPTVNSPISEQGNGPSNSGNNSSSDLENYELGPYYGDSLTQ